MIGLAKKSVLWLEISLKNFFFSFVNAHHWRATEVLFRWTEISKWFFLERLQFCHQLFLHSAYPSRDYFITVKQIYNLYLWKSPRVVDVLTQPLNLQISLLNTFIPPLRNITMISRIILQCGWGNRKQSNAGLTSVTMTGLEHAMGFSSAGLACSWLLKQFPGDIWMTCLLIRTQFDWFLLFK